MLNKEEKADYYKAMWDLAESISKSDMRPVVNFIDDTKAIVEGKREAFLLQHMSVQEMKENVLDTTFFHKMGNLVLEIQRTFGDYLIDREKLTTKIN